MRTIQICLSDRLKRCGHFWTEILSVGTIWGQRQLVWNCTDCCWYLQCRLCYQGRSGREGMRCGVGRKRADVNVPLTNYVLPSDFVIKMS
jgi:hypothetical protein